MAGAPTHDDFLRALGMLGVAPPAPGCETAWREEALRPAWREAVKRVHPDGAGPDATPAAIALRTEKTVELNAAYALLQGLRVVRRAPAPMPGLRVVFGGFSTTTAATGGVYLWPGGSETWGRGGPFRAPYPGASRK